MAILNMNYGGGGEEYTAGDGIDISDGVISATNTGKARVLTEADYNWPTSNPDGVAAWLLPDGFYEAVGVKIYWSSNTNYSNATFVKATTSNNDQYVFCIRKDVVERVTISRSQALFYKILSVSDVVDNLTTANPNFPLSANQGKVLKDLVDSLAIRGTGAPTTSTVGQVGTLYEDTTNGKLYQCSAVDTTTDPDTYTWTEVGGGSGPTVVQTTGQSTTDVMSQKGVTDAITANGAGTRRATSTGWNTSKTLDYILQASDAPSSAQGAMFYTGTNLSDFPVYAGIGVKANETAAKYTPYLLIQTTSDDGQGITTGSPIAYQIALHSEIPATFTTNEWDALWA